MGRAMRPRRRANVPLGQGQVLAEGDVVEVPGMEEQEAESREEERQDAEELFVAQDIQAAHHPALEDDQGIGLSQVGQEQNTPGADDADGHAGLDQSEDH